ncbi:hypothetical protein Trydic_g4489, partial [Trypoxylus dichotomus]
MSKETIFSYETLVHALAGSAGSIFAMTVFYPLDTIRFRLQLEDSDRDLSTFEVLSNIIRNEGIEALYRGLKPVLLSLGIINVIVTAPLWVVNSRLKVEQQKYYTGLLDGLVHIANTEGLAALWSGIGSSLVLVSNPAIQFAVYEALKRHIPLKSASAFFLMGAVAKAVATMATYPIQLAQSRQRNELHCFKVKHNLRQWALNYNTVKGTVCDAVEGRHLIIIETRILTKLSNAELLPFPQSLYLQTSFLNYTVKVLQGIAFQEEKSVLKSHHAHLIKQQTNGQKLKRLYNMFNIKQVTKDGIIQWYGCDKDTYRCFPTVLNSMPSYLYDGRWTPPCCLENLRKTALHVFNSLDEAGVRYWLESGSLLGAMRSGDILPWDHDVDIGINRDDISRCVWLEKAKNKSVLDNRGFLWERATENNFFRV